MTPNRLQLDSIMADSRWFEGSAVVWDKMPTSAETNLLVEKRASRLEQKPKLGLRPNYAQLQLAYQLQNCTIEYPCKSGQCPRCGGAFQAWATANVVELTAKEKLGSVSAITVIPPMPLLNVLTGDDLSEAIITVYEAVLGTELINWGVLCLDISYNDFTQVAEDWPDSEPTFGWQPHVHGFVKTNKLAAFKKAMKRRLTARLGTPVPLLMEPFDGTAYGASYAFKPQFYRRVSYFDDNGVLRTKAYRLSAALDVELMKAMAELGLAGRIQLIGLSTIKNTPKNNFSLIVTA